MSVFHFAFKVKDIDSTRKFYVDILGCKEGRSTESWIDFDFFDNQLSEIYSDSNLENILFFINQFLKIKLRSLEFYTNEWA